MLQSVIANEATSDSVINKATKEVKLKNVNDRASKQAIWVVDRIRNLQGNRKMKMT